MTSRTWEDNAQEYADLDQGEGWAFAVLVACSVEKGAGHGGYHDHSERREPDDENDHGKVSATKFAQRAGTGKDRVLEYLKGWERATIAGVVLPAADLTPADAHKVVLPDVPFKQFYISSVGQNVPTERRDKIRAQALEDGTGPSKAVDIASNPRALAAAIKADPDTAEAARKALKESWDKDYRERWNAPPTPHDDERERRLREADLNARERELAEQDTKDRLLGSVEILAELSHYCYSGDRLLGRWSGRRVKLSAAEREAYLSLVADLLRIGDGFRRLAEGNESPEEELRRISQEQPR